MIQSLQIVCEPQHIWSQGPDSPEALSVLPVSDADGGVHGKESQELFI